METLRNVLLVPGGGSATAADVTIDADGIVTVIEPAARAGDDVLLPYGVDLHLDNLSERRRPRATVVLDLPGVVAGLDAECAANGVGVVLLSARCEETPRKGIFAREAVELARTVDQLQDTLACQVLLHARVEVTDSIAVDTLEELVETTDRVALVSVMEHTLEKSRFASHEEHVAFYAEDWGVSREEVEEILAAARIDEDTRRERRARVAEIAHAAGITLASHDDRTPEAVEDGHRLGATISEFPLSREAAVRAAELEMLRVLGAPNAVRGKSTSPGNILVADAVREGLVDALCSDYLPSSLMQAPFSLEARGVAPVEQTIDLVSKNPGDAIGLEVGRIEVGRPLDAALLTRVNGTVVGRRLWRGGRETFRRS